MSETLFTEASMSDSFIYSMFNASNTVQAQILRGLKNGIRLDESFIQEQMIQLQKVRLSPLSDTVLNAFRDEKINLIYVKDERITKSLPFILHKDKSGHPVASIFISSFATLTRDQTALIIPMKNLYVLMESAYIGLVLATNSLVIRRSSTLMKLTMNIFVSMYIRILNRDYALSIDPVLHDNVSYVIAQFFLRNLWEIDNDDIIHNAASSLTKTMRDDELRLLALKYEHAKITDVSKLFEFIREEFPTMSSLNVRHFVERYLNTYNGASVMSIDYLPYVFFVIVNVMLGGFLVSQTVLSDIIKNTKGMNRFYSELTKLVREY